MRRVRFTYEGAFHHGMNRGINGDAMFEGNQNKSFFLDFLEESVLKYKMRFLAYCVMNNHYHPVLEETIERFNRRQDGYGPERQRIDDRFFEPLARIIYPGI